MSYERVKFVEILTTSNAGDIAFLKSLFAANDIVCFFEGENFSQVYPLVVPVRVKVDSTQVEDVKILLKDFKSGNFGCEVD